MLSSFRNNLFANLILAASLVSLVLMTSFAAGTYHSEKVQSEQQMLSLFDQIESGFVSSIAKSIRENNHAQLDALLHGILAIPSVVEVRLSLKDKPGKGYIYGYSQSDKINPIVKNLEINYLVDDVITQLGSLRVVLNQSLALKQNTRRVIAGIIGDALLILVFCLLLYCSYRNHLCRPIHRISSLARSFEVDAHQSNIPASSTPQSDIITLLETDLRQMQEKSIRYIRKKNLMTKELRKYQYDLEALVAEKTKKLNHASHKLGEASRQEGMASIAIDFVHSFGNSLTSLRVESESLVMLSQCRETDLLKELANMVEDKGFSSKLTEQGYQSKLVAFIKLCDKSIEQQFLESRCRAVKVKKLVDQAIMVIEDQKIHTQYKPLWVRFSVGDMIAEALEMIEERCHLHEIRIHQTIPEGLTLVSDRYKLYYSLTNILNNAVDSLINIEGERYIRISASADPTGKFLSVRVEDCGCGIPQKDLDMVFRYGYSTKDNHPGIGLHNAANWLQSIGGRIQVHSLAQGTLVEVSIKIQQENKQTA